MSGCCWIGVVSSWTCVYIDKLLLMRLHRFMNIYTHHRLAQVKLVPGKDAVSYTCLSVHFCVHHLSASIRYFMLFSHYFPISQFFFEGTCKNYYCYRVHCYFSMKTIFLKNNKLIISRFRQPLWHSQFMTWTLPHLEKHYRILSKTLPPAACPYSRNVWP